MRVRVRVRVRVRKRVIRGYKMKCARISTLFSFHVPSGDKAIMSLRDVKKQTIRLSSLLERISSYSINIK